MRNFILDTLNADAWRRLLIAGEKSPSLDQVEGLTLSGAMEFFSMSVGLDGARELARSVAQAGLAGHPFWHPLLLEWNHLTPTKCPSAAHGCGHFEFFRLRDEADLTGASFYLFQQRFRRSIEENGFPKDFAYALTKVLSEMSDNVIQHSGRTANGYSGLAGYHTEPEFLAFAVVDAGRGILDRLRDSFEWRQLASAQEAIRSIVGSGASSREGQGSGEGFKQLFKSLVDRNGVVRLRTGDYSIRMADGKNSREGGELISPAMPGVQVSAHFALRERAVEKSVNFSLLQ